MNYDKYKQDFIAKRLFNLIILEKTEIDKIPRKNKKEEYEYITANNIVFLNENYYKKVSEPITDEELSLYLNMENVRLATNIQNELTQIKESQEKSHKNNQVILLIFFITWLLSNLFF